jgi:hypothetical protein
MRRASRAGEPAEGGSSKRTCQFLRTGSESLTIKKNIFKSWHVFRGRKSVSPDHKNTTNSPRKNHQNTIKKYPLFPKPPVKTPVSAVRKKYQEREKMVEAVGVGRPCHLEKHVTYTF